MVHTRAATKRVESGQDAFFVIPFPIKKRKTDREGDLPKKRRRGKPGELCQLNLDVLYLISGYIHPLDLLNLARTSKSLRELLMDKSSEFVWKTARGQVPGLPCRPTDLTEPEYANLVFHARCHGCGKYAKKVLWKIRRRYCPGCRVRRLRNYFSCDTIVQEHYVIPMEALVIDGEKGRWVDQEQLDSFLQEYHRSSDKETLLAERRQKLRSILFHAGDCEDWERGIASEHRDDLEIRRRERDDSIFERLKQHGYAPEIEYHGYHTVKKCQLSFFKTAKPLTDREWARMLPEWTESMKSLRNQRMERTVYQPRRNILVSKHNNFVEHPSPNTPVFDLLPHWIDFLRFPPFRDIIYTPEGTQLGPDSFESAFGQLPDLVNEWRKQLDIDLAGLIKIPSSAQGGPTSTKSSPVVPTDKLRLACAIFEVDYSLARYPEVFFRMRPKDVICEVQDSKSILPLSDRFKVSFLEAAPYIVQACGLDPNVATVEDMDHRNARFKCTLCNDRYIRKWRNAMRHARSCGRHHYLPRWEIADDGQIDAIQAFELKNKGDPRTDYTRCLLCRPCVGGSIPDYDVMAHLVGCHGIDKEAVRQDVHFAAVSMHMSYCQVRMADDGTFEELSNPNIF